MTTDGGVQFSRGGPVLVTEKGTEALFARSHGMVSISIC
jgi:hypothetical protein